MNPQSSATPATSEPEALAKLAATFDSFNRMSSELAHAWGELRDRTARLDVALNDANLRLNEKVVELDELNSNLDAILDSIPSAAIVTDTQLSVTKVNRTAAAMLGIDRGEALGRSAHEIVDASGRPILTLCHSPLPPLQTGTPTREVTLPGGDTRTVTSRVSRVVDARGQSLGYVEILTDMTETEALRARLHRLDTLAALGEMAAAIAHELRTPLTAVEGYAGLIHRSLQRGDPPSVLIPHVDKITRGAREAATIIQRILTFANPGVMTRENVALPQLVGDVLADHSSVHVRLDPSCRTARIKGDRLLLRQALRNLVANALAFCPEDQITLSAATDGKVITLAVEDRGPGIAEAIRDKLFMPFVTGRVGGTGLGLAIVHRIIDLHGGTIRADDHPQGGACFIIQLPAMAPAHTDEATL